MTGCLVAASCGTGIDPPRAAVGDSAGIPVYELADVPDWDEPRFLVELELERSIPTGSEAAGSPPLLYDPQRFTRLRDGTLVVLDGGDPRLAVVSPERDSVVARFARTGQGPGEIWSAGSILWPGEGRSFWILDGGNSRLSRFSLDGRLLDEARVELPGAGGLVTLRPGTHEPFFWRVFLSAVGPGASLSDSVVRFDPATRRGAPIAPMPPRHPLRTMNTSPVTLFVPGGTFTPVASGGVVVGRTDLPRLWHYSDEGALLGIVVLPLEPRPLPGSAKPAILQEVAAEFPPAARWSLDVDQFEMWDHMWPIGDSLVALEHTRWSTPDGEEQIPPHVRVWRLISVTGRYVGVVRLPDGFGYPYWFERDRIVGVRRDSLGVGTIESYRLRIPR